MWSWFKKNFPTSRTLDVSRSEVPITSDLDSLIADPIVFRWNGTLHRVKPMDTKTFFQTCEKYQSLIQTKELKSETGSEFINAYGDFFSSVCDTIGRKEVAMMSVAQVAALTQLVLDAISGRAQVGDDSKKKPIPPHLTMPS